MYEHICLCLSKKKQHTSCRYILKCMVYQSVEKKLLILRNLLTNDYLLIAAFKQIIK